MRAPRTDTKHLNHRGFDIFGPGRGHTPAPAVPASAVPAPADPCTHCHDGLAQCGYHGPPGDDRGSIPCPRCRIEAWDAFVLGGGDILHGTNIETVLGLLHEYPR